MSRKKQNPSSGGRRSDVTQSQQTLPESNVDGVMPSPVLGGREVRRLEWTEASRTDTVEGRTRGNVRRLHATETLIFLVQVLT